VRGVRTLIHRECPPGRLIQKADGGRGRRGAEEETREAQNTREGKMAHPTPPPPRALIATENIRAGGEAGKGEGDRGRTGARKNGWKWVVE